MEKKETKEKHYYQNWNKINKPESTASTSRSMASAFTKGETKNWENLIRNYTTVSYLPYPSQTNTTFFA